MSHSLIIILNDSHVQIDLHFVPSLVYSNVSKREIYTADYPEYREGQIGSILNYWNIPIHEILGIIFVKHEFPYEGGVLRDEGNLLRDINLLGISKILRIGSNIINQYEQNSLPITWG